MTNQVPFNWDADLGPTDEELIARGSMPAFREQESSLLVVACLPSESRTMLAYSS